MRLWVAVWLLLPIDLVAQQKPIAYVPTQGVALSGSLSVENGKASIANSGTVTAGDQTAHLTLARGGELELCASTTVHLSQDRSVGDASSSALLIALDRGALEANYTPGKYSDVLMTPDLRILISGPGSAELKVRVNQKGDTCVDNHGANAPYVTVSSQFEGGIYRVQPNQRVLFEHGSLQQVVDNEPEPCGCPASPAVSVASAGVSGSHPAKSGQPVGGPSSTPADTAFPLAESEGLKPPPPPPSRPVVPPGTAHAEVQVPLTYNSAVDVPPVTPAKVQPPAEVSQAAPPAPTVKKQKTGFLHHVGHFFARIFGK
ncbi:hypothetical protein [Acidipila rosea]|uniref:FecR family protein n=1 Tax=Acidipila rosea TaxID=768535 RepID=A0A4V2PUV6_9BACT|nr:hypothetical protein [Acidipila rosea]TCK71941.1 hypothetical protein C7378_2564 [Acidipila rosea]